MTQNISQEEKIDYIYNRLKKQESQEKRQFITKWLLRIAIIGYVYYLIMIALPNMISGMIPDLPSTEGLNIENMQKTFSEYFSNEK